MATSQQQWRSGSQLFLLAAASALVLFIGSADAKCATGYGDCDGITSNGCETNVYNDPYNCAYCHNKCKTYPHTVTTCKNGKCTWVCNDLYGDCDGKINNGCEKYLSQDPYNCGYCHNKCQLSPDYKYGEAYCSGGKCYSRCPTGWKYNSSGKYCYQ